ncbi:MAG: MFS transporter [Acidobacteriota bacterium]|nr:MFS transporter [Acidobacteriota bacterium]
MSFFPGAAAYGRLLRLPTARRAVVASSVCRLSFGTLVLALLLAVEHATTSFAAAGAASAVFSLCTLSGPAKARFIGDQHQRGPVVILSAAYVSSLGGLALLAGNDFHRAALFIALSATAGLSVPPVGAMMRARWATITAVADRQRAFALDLALEDGLFFAGPLLTGALVAVGGPVIALWVTAALFAAGASLLVAGQAAMARPGARHPRHADRRSKGVLQPLRSSRARAVLLVLLGVSAGAGVIDVAVTARAVHDRTPAAAGYVLAAVAMGSVVGGLTWGHVAHRLRPGWQLAGLGGLVAATLAASTVAPTLPSLAAVLMVNGAALSPLLVVVYVIVDSIAGDDNRTLLSTWVNTTFNAGVAAGAAAGGALVASTGPASAFLVGAATAATAAAVAILVRHLVTPGRSQTGGT